MNGSDTNDFNNQSYCMKNRKTKIKNKNMRTISMPSQTSDYFLIAADSGILVDILSLQLKLHSEIFFDYHLEFNYVFELGFLLNKIAYEFCMRLVYKNLEVHV